MWVRLVRRDMRQLYNVDLADGCWSDTEMTRVDDCVITVVLSDNSTVVLYRVFLLLPWLLV